MSLDLRVAVTGARGYLGGVIAAAVEKAGGRALRLSRTSGGFSLQAPPSPETAASWGADALVHCAYDFSPAEASANVAGSMALFRSAKRAGVERLVFISSLSAFEGCASVYGRGKRAVEAEVLALGGAVVRPGTVYGPRPGGMMGALLARASGGGRTPVLGHPGPLFLTHEDDLAGLVLSLLRRPLPFPSQPVFAAHPQGWSLKTLVKALGSAQGKRVRTLTVPWWAAWAALRTMETVGMKPAFRSDSALSLGVPFPSSEKGRMAEPETAFRPFESRAISGPG